MRDDDSNDEMPDDPDDDSVGYRRPPRNTRFRKGQSGNPRGRPPRKVLHEVIIDVLNEEIPVTIDGEKVMMTKKEAAIQKLVTESMKGKSTATRNLIVLLRVLSHIPPI